MKYLFVLGTNPHLSLAEITARFGLPKAALKETTDDYLVVESDQLPKAEKMMNLLGGTIKIGQVIDEDITPETLASYLGNLRLNRAVFGISHYGSAVKTSRRQGQDLQRGLIRLGMETKRLLKEAHISSRFVRPQEGLTLSSVTVDKNELLKNGAEFMIFGDSGLAVTEAVQPFEEFSMIDFGRPARNAKQGMLPPKLARIMLNLSRANETDHVWDPFCGSGTVLTEALHLKIKKAYGTDLNPQAAKDTEENLAWLRKNQPETRTETVVAVHDARRPIALIPDHSLNAVVTETFLGVPRQGRENRAELTARLKEIAVLMEQSLRNWKPYLKPGAAVVLALPAYVAEQDILLTEIRLPNGYAFERLVPTGTTDQGGILYGRKGQLVWREIVRIRKI